MPKGAYGSSPPERGHITERANIARTIAQLVQTRHKIAQLQLAQQIGKLSTVAACSMHDSQPDEATVIFRSPSM